MPSREPPMSYCRFFDTQDEAIAACREANRGLSSADPRCCAVIDGPENDYAVVDQETAKEILDYEETRISYLIVTD